MSITPQVHKPAASQPTRPAGPLLKVQHAAKAFGSTIALRDCSFELLAGEVHAIVGENGSGKSTLVKILSGVHAPDSGQIEIAGAPLAGRTTPSAAQAQGIVTVFQEVLVVGTQSVLDNVWLGTDSLLRHRGTGSERRRIAETTITDLLGSCPPLDTPIAALSLSERQACCIARALVRQPKVLILDESTSAVDVQTRDRLFSVVRRLVAAGTGVVFITHRMEEIETIADRITVLRSGESVATVKRADTTTDELVRHMTGSDHLTADAERRRDAVPTLGDTLIRAEDVKLRADADPIDFELRAGELVGLAGLEGQGQDTFLRVLAGTQPLSGTTRAGNGAPINSPRAAFNAGIAYVPRDRRDESMFPSLSITENFASVTLREDQRLGLLSWGNARRRLAKYVERVSIKASNHGQPLTVLSGGNQQKVIVARWLAAEPSVLLLNDPTRGVDLAAKRDLYRLLEEVVSRGVGVVMLSTEVDEHVELMDRVLVFRDGTVAAEMPRNTLDRNKLVSRFFGEHGEDHAG